MVELLQRVFLNVKLDSIKIKLYLQNISSPIMPPLRCSYPLMSNHNLVAAAASPEDPHEQSPYLKRTLGPFLGLA